MYYRTITDFSEYKQGQATIFQSTQEYNIQGMFTAELGQRKSSPHCNSTLQNIQYQLFGSYIKYASQKLVVKETQLMVQSQLLLQKISQQQQVKSNTQLCTTQASFYNSRCLDDKSSCRSRELRTAFKRKSRFLLDKKTKHNLNQALQEIRQICSQKSIALVESLFAEYQKMIEEQGQADYRQGNLKRKRDRCQNCLAKESQLQLKSQHYQQKIISLNIDIQSLQKKCDDLSSKLNATKRQQQEGIDRQKAIFDNCREYLIQKESSLSGKCTQLKLIQRQICNAIHTVSQRRGCERCELVRSVKGQILEYRRYYERQYQKLQKLFQRYKKIFR